MSQMQEQLLLSKHIFFTSLIGWYILCVGEEKCNLSGLYCGENTERTDNHE